MNHHLSVGLIGPLPPPSGGMANQTRQLARLLAAEGMNVTLVRTNRNHRPEWIGRVRALRELFRLIPYIFSLWSTARHVELFHVMANSGWAWHLVAGPAIWIAKIRRIPVIVNYRGGGAEVFFSSAGWWARHTMARADALVTPSGFLKQVFENLGFPATVVPNIIDLERFRPASSYGSDSRKRIVVTRNLEPIYDIPTALRAFALVHARVPAVALTVAGSGPELPRLQQLARNLGIEDDVTFAGRIDNEQMPQLYQSARVMLNPSLVDNMPVSVLEAFASGVPVVSTNVGGVPFMAEDGRTALLVRKGDAEAMAEALVRILNDDGLASRLSQAGLEEARRYGWDRIRGLWLSEYNLLISADCRLEGGA